MKKALVMITALAIGSAFVGCSSKSTPATPAPPPVAVAPPKAATSPDQPVAPPPVANSGWSLKLQSKCQSVTDDQCLAGYGFTVFSDGKYQLGPTTAGAVKTGNLTADELNTLTSALTPVLTAAPIETDSHEPVAADDAASEDTVTLARGSAEGEVMIHVAATDLAFRTQSGDLAKALLSAMKNLATKYYSVPYPDACADNAAALEAIFTSLQTCTADADCGYLDSNYNVIDPNTHSFITTDDCTLVKPMSVANLKLMNDSRDKIATSLGTLQDSCGARLMRTDCTEITGFTINSAATCKQGVCQASPVSTTSH